MTVDGGPAEIGLLLYPNVQLAAIHGLTDLFVVASRLAGERAGRPVPGLRVSQWRPGLPDGAIARIADTHPHLPGGPAVIVVPPSLGAPPADAAPLARWLVERHGGGSILCSVCAGTFLLAQTGLLDGRAATTHWSYGDVLAQRFPALRVDTDKLIIDDGDVVTAGGVMAWTDLGLRLVDRLLGPTVMMATARFLLVDPPGREQRYYSNFAPRLRHGDEAVLRVQHWLQAQGAVQVTMADMARRAGLGERTFLRRFHKATGLKPTEYCQHLRVGKAREMLEFTSRSVEQVAWAVGYEDPGAFRKVFHKVTGLSPGDYRRRFSAGRMPAERG